LNKGSNFGVAYVRASSVRAWQNLEVPRKSNLEVQRSGTYYFPLISGAAHCIDTDLHESEQV